ncbi:MAG: hypothetical protein HeimC3_50250 [Candidatus Heimdallarchaeota archaeon LC_3]|nr:MAG: hypothetical protein HeimC3_50250 [Candidatus Heimdallarchaeota archaeon LC_3]
MAKFMESVYLDSLFYKLNCPSLKFAEKVLSDTTFSLTKIIDEILQN